MTRLALLAMAAASGFAVAVLLGRRTRREPTASAVLAPVDEWEPVRRDIQTMLRRPLRTGPIRGGMIAPLPYPEPDDGIQPPDPGLTMGMGGAK